MRGKLGDKARLQHIFDAILEVENYLLNTDFSEKTRNTILRQLLKLVCGIWFVPVTLSAVFTPKVVYLLIAIDNGQ